MDTPQVKAVELNLLRVRTESALALWASEAFGLPSERLSLTSYSADFARMCIATHAAKTRTNFHVRLRHRWLASYTVRKILFGKEGWSSWLGYRLMHDDGVYVSFGA